ncbi:MAG: S8 family serine peptidase [Gemmatimonadales bacterium]
MAGLMPLRAIGVASFLSRFPSYDGRGVIIGIMDTGLDAGLIGLQETSMGTAKLLDLRDFSREGLIELTPIAPSPNGVVDVGGVTVSGFGRLARLAPPPYYGGLFREQALGGMPAADVNGNGWGRDLLPVVVGRASDGWVVMTDTNGDGSLVDESPIRDYLVARETFSYRSGSQESGPITIAVNTSERDGFPQVIFYFDNDGHGSHVAGIAAGHRMFGVPGFDGVAPGAYLLGLKISNNSRGGTSVTGGILQAMNYAAVFAERRGLPLVLNLSFGTGAEIEGTASIDSLVNDFILKHPHILLVASAGNDGPGVSTVSQPATADYALSVCGLFPGVFLQTSDSGMVATPDVLGWWSSRGGEVAKPDVCAPGVAFSNVPPWRTGAEVSAGTSMASPQVAGAAALLVSALSQENRVVRAVDLKLSLSSTAAPVPSETAIDAGRGVPNVFRAYQWLQAAHQVGLYDIRSLPDGGNTSQASGAYRRNGFQGDADTIQRFVVTSVGGQPAAMLLLQSDVPWLRTPPSIDFSGTPVTVELTYDVNLVTQPGLYVGTVWARSASDTLAGALFGLTNTVIVPIPLEERYETLGSLRPGEIQRYFFNVKNGTAGMHVELELLGRAGSASLYVFEPNGQPYRGNNHIDIGPDTPHRLSLDIPANDLVAGVYELVVTSSRASSAAYRVGVEAPPIKVVRSGPNAAALVNTTDLEVKTRIHGRLVGSVRRDSIHGTGSGTSALSGTIPGWAGEIVIDLEVPGPLWSQLTDLGLSLVDTSGNLLHAGWIKYARGRMRIPVDVSWLGTPFEIEVLPGFAHMMPPQEWSGELGLAFMLDSPREIRLAGADTFTTLDVGPRDSVEIQIGSLPPDLRLPAGFSPLFEIFVDPTTGATTTAYIRGDAPVD